eukprot:m.31985 g.31985  ORF g.31985 m.31985 type:complete len:312 (+) comp31584_c0_seq1:220-1155(+)
MLTHRGAKSMRQKRDEHLEAKRAHEGNVTTGHVNTNEEMLRKSGLRGRKSRAFYIILAIIAFLVFANLLMTAMILGVLRIEASGIPTLHLGTKDTVVFRKSATLFDVWIDKFVGAYANETLSVNSSDGSQLRALVGMIDGKRKGVIIANQSVEFRNSFTVQSNQAVLAKFDETQAEFNKLTLLQPFTLSTLTAKRVFSDASSGLTFSSDKHVRATATEIVSVRSTNASFSAGNNSITVDTDKSITLTGKKDGVKMSGLPSNDGSAGNGTGFKLCACVSNDASSGVRIAQFYKVKASKSGCKTDRDPCVNLG